MNARVPDLTMHAGDLIIDSEGEPTAGRFWAIWNQLDGEQHYVLGNHEADPDPQSQWFDPENHYAPANWFEPLFACDSLTPIPDCKRWYSIYIGNPPRVAVFVVSNNSDELDGDAMGYHHCTTPNDSLNHAGSTQRLWLENEINTLAATIEVVFVFGHRTYYGVEDFYERGNILYSGVGDGPPGSAPAETLRTGAVSFLRDLESIYVRQPNVRLVAVVSGDQHCFAEVERLRENAPDSAGGVKYLVMGISGARNQRSAVYPDLGKIPAGTLVYAFDDMWGYGRFEVAGDRVDLFVHEAYTDSLIYQTSWPFDGTPTYTPSDDSHTTLTAAELRLWPNPTTGVISIECTLPHKCRHEKIIQFAIYDVTGRLTRRLYQGRWEQGVCSRTWDLRGDDGNPVAAGTYFAHMRFADCMATTKIVVTR
jgi:hypothetical protein